MPLQADTTFIPSPALWTAIFAAIGYIVSQYVTLWRDDRAKRLQFTIEHAERQLTEFYAPLIALFAKLNTTADIKTSIQSKVSVADPRRAFFEEFIYYSYFLEQHLSIQKVLSEKIHLLEGWQIPESYNLYLKHFTSENIFNNLLYKQNKPFAFDVFEFPEEFISDLKQGQDLVLRRYEDCLAEQRRPILWGRAKSQGDLAPSASDPLPEHCG